MTEEDALKPETVEELRRLRGAGALPAALEARVVAALRARGLIAPRWPLRRFSLAAGIGAVLFLGGYALGSRGGAPAPRPAAPPTFVLLLEEDAGFARGTPEDGRRRVAEYRHWALGVARQGRLVAGEKLAREARVVSADGIRPVPSDGLETGASQVAGYFVVRAASLDEAARLATSCPHLRHRGRIVVRQIVAK